MGIQLLNWNWICSLIQPHFNCVELARVWAVFRFIRNLSWSTSESFSMRGFRILGCRNSEAWTTQDDTGLKTCWILWVAAGSSCLMLYRVCWHLDTFSIKLIWRLLRESSCLHSMFLVLRVGRLNDCKPCKPQANIYKPASRLDGFLPECKRLLHFTLNTRCYSLVVTVLGALDSLQ